MVRKANVWLTCGGRLGLDSDPIDSEEVFERLMLDLGDDSRIFCMKGGNVSGVEKNRRARERNYCRVLTETIDPHRFPPHLGCIAR